MVPKVSVLLATLLVGALVHVAVGQSSTNDWDGHQSIHCDDGWAVGFIKSTHSNRAEDRKYEIKCNSDIGSHSECSWTGYVNDWDKPVNFICSDNGVITGISSDHNNRKEDRRWKFRCCKSPVIPEECYWTSFLNDWDRAFTYQLPSDRVIRGVYSEHHNRHEDRRWKVFICRRFVPPCSCPAAHTEGNLGNCKTGDQQGPHAYGCLKMWWEEAGCTEKGLNHPSRTDVAWWNARTAAQVQADMRRFAQYAREGRSREGVPYTRLCGV